MVARHQNVAGLLPADDPAYRQPRADPFGKRNDVRPDPVLFEGKKSSRSAYSGLDLIIDEKDVFLSAKIICGLHEFLIQSMDPAFALHKLHDESARIILLCQSLQLLRIVDFSMHKARDERREHLLRLGQAGSSYRGKSPAVERLFQRNNSILLMVCQSIAVFPGSFDSSLIGLAARVGEPDLAKACPFDQLLRHHHAGLRIVQVGCMLHLPELPGHRLQPGFVLIAQRIRAVAAAEIYILFAVHISDHSTLCMIGHYIIAVICMNNKFSILSLDLIPVHHTSPPVLP